FFTNMALLLVAHEVLGYPKIPAQIAITCLTVVINYFGHKYFSFRRPEAVSPKKATEESTT
ncbi:MAG TPA: GtrA family protein, partial [Arthrobacter sp.]|nr:GtrA family protein [Arthrobacter sp.]